MSSLKVSTEDIHGCSVALEGALVSCGTPAIRDNALECRGSLSGVAAPSMLDLIVIYKYNIF